jgi:hypothetical protein
MAFKIKDLMINVVPSDPHGRGTPTDCTAITNPTLGPGQVVLFGFIPCSFAQCGATVIPTDLFQSHGSSVAALSTLKEQLKQQLAEVEKRQAAAEESLLPNTVEEVDMLTKKLNDALDELKGRRAELSRKSKPAKNK